MTVSLWRRRYNKHSIDYFGSLMNNKCYWIIDNTGRKWIWKKYAKDVRDKWTLNIYSIWYCWFFIGIILSKSQQKYCWNVIPEVRHVIYLGVTKISSWNMERRRWENKINTIWNTFWHFFFCFWNILISPWKNNGAGETSKLN